MVKKSCNILEICYAKTRRLGLEELAINIILLALAFASSNLLISIIGMVLQTIGIVLVLQYLSDTYPALCILLDHRTSLEIRTIVMLYTMTLIVAYSIGLYLAGISRKIPLDLAGLELGLSIAYLYAISRRLGRLVKSLK